MNKQKVAVALSGGVDSGVAAGLLKKAGWQVTGVHLQLWTENPSAAELRTKRAQKMARILKIPLKILDLRKEFKKQIVDEFFRVYLNGETPNPCVFCNQKIKFGKLLDYIFEKKFDYLATGHYVRIINHKLFRAKDLQKDQSYFLYRLNQKQLSHLLFPLGDYYKKEVWQLAKKWHLPLPKESQQICFLNRDYQSFLKRERREKIIPGKVVNHFGEVIGQHFGLPLYTIGQRHGFETKINQSLYVINKDLEENRLIVGFKEEARKKEFFVKNLNWIDPNILISQYRHIQVKIRYQGKLLSSKLKAQSSKLRIILKKPQTGIAPGQSVVFYHHNEILGGGIISD